MNTPGSAFTDAITALEVDRFRRDGYLVVPNALDGSALENVQQGLARFEAAVPPNKTSSHYNYADIFGVEPAFVDLIDCPKVFPKIWGILGYNIRVNHSHVNEDLPRADDRDFMWHRDGACAVWDLSVQPMPMMGIKVGYYLTDVPREGYGGTYVIPGSQHSPSDLLPRQDSAPSGAVPILGPAGTAFLFDPRMMHCRSPNRSDRTRKAIFLQYGFRWLAPLDLMRTAELDGLCQAPIRRQLLGLNISENQARRSNTWYPRAQDLPLRQWLIEQLGDQVEQRVGLLTSLPRGWSQRDVPNRPSQFFKMEP